MKKQNTVYQSIHEFKKSVFPETYRAELVAELTTEEYVEYIFRDSCRKAIPSHKLEEAHNERVRLIEDIESSSKSTK